VAIPEAGRTRRLPPAPSREAPGPFLRAGFLAVGSGPRLPDRLAAGQWRL